MPTYEYRCDACGNEFEIEQRITDDRLEKCPKCKKKKLVRLVGTGNFILKGGGWYKDLYSSTPKKSGSSDDKKSGSGESKSEKAESKSEKTPDAKKPEKKADKKAKAD